MDNPPCHKGRASRSSIRQAGAHLPLLPPCNPDFNLIEQVFVKSERMSHNAAERTAGGIRRRIGDLLDQSPA